jgi:hypothetical protein
VKRAEGRAAQVSVHTAIACSLLAIAAFVLVILTWRRAAARNPAGRPEEMRKGNRW